MNSLAEVWLTLLELLRNELTSTAINTWFSECTPVELENNRLVIYTPSEFKRDILSQRFASNIKVALTELFSSEFELLVITDDELDSYRETVKDDDLPIIEGFTFDKFIVGASNKFAHAAAIAVSENPGTAYNPLFIYGNSGLGKTHLLLAIGQSLRSRDKHARISYVKGDEFTNEMVHSLRVHTQQEFREKYRYADLFLVDDIQFISGKFAVQEEFFHTFNTLYESKRQIVITSDRPPVEINKIEDRLRSRFEGGLLADVQTPDLETRIAIITNKAASLGLFIQPDVTEFIAETISANIRQIEGVVKKMSAYKSIENANPDLVSARRAIKDVIRLGEFGPTPDSIIEETARYFSLPVAELVGQRRSKTISTARQLAMYLIRSLTGLPLVEIGSFFDDRNHSTVISSIRKIEKLLETDTELTSTMQDIASNINSRN